MPPTATALPVPVRALLAAASIVVLACSGPENSGETAAASGDAGARPEAATGPAAEADQPRIPDSQLGSLDREDLTLSLPWTRGRINRDAPDAASRTALRSVAFSQTENVDRMTLVFDSAGDYPGYVVESSMSPLPRCASADSVPLEGQGLLRVRVRNATADESVAGPSLQRPDLANVLAVHRSCLEDSLVEWILDVDRATYYRVVQASDPPRLVVDVMQAVDGGGDSGTSGGS